MDGKIIVVSKAKYPGYDRKHISVGKSAKKGSRSVDQGIGVGKSDTAKLVNPIFMDSRSYRDVLLGNSKPDVPAINLDRSEKLSSQPAKPHSPLDIHIPKKTMTWINFSPVGVLKMLYELDFVQKALLSDGIKVKLARWGNMSNSCVLSFESDEELEEAWRLKKEALVFWFDHIAPINNEDGVHAAFYSIALTGVPLHCWHESFFASIGNRWGSFIELDHSTRNLENFSEARMLVRAASPFDFPNSFSVRFRGRSFIIKIKFEDYSPVLARHEDPESVENFADVWSSDEEASVYCHANENLEIPSGESCKMQSSEESPTSSSSHLQGNASCPIVEELPEMSRPFPKENVFGKVVNINCDINKETDFDECVKGLSENCMGLSENCKGPSRVGTRINTLFAGASRVNDPTGLGLGGILVGTNSFTNARASSSLHSALGLEDLVSDSSFRSRPNVIIFSKSIDFVPDSYDNQDSVLGKSRLENGEVNQRPQVVGSKDPLFSSNSPCKDLLNPIHRKLVRKSIREAIDGASPPFLNTLLHHSWKSWIL
ncbi:hypothetical protein V6N13_147376 [Hibiscus sabdariffa]|uniref:Uncharacterized protein n=2 Tax=Hibiscus sabdariffa TaxID=183260 RepID=A0ABR2TVF0_9ROSI